MESKAVVIKITEDAQLGKAGEIVAECKSMFVADLFVTGLNRSDLHNIERNTLGYIAVQHDKISSAETSYSFALKK